MKGQHALATSVDVGGRRVRVFLQGSRSTAADEVTFVIEAALGWHADMYRWIIEGLSPYGAVAAYDRSGLGRSDPGGRCDGNSRVDELQALVECLRLKPPLVLVGHSIGGLYARLYASRHPGGIAGIVLLDATHDAAFEVIRERVPLGGWLWRRVARYAMALGARRLWFPSLRIARAPWNTLPSAAKPTIREISREVGPLLRAAEEGAALSETSRQARGAGGLGSLPVLVITAGTRTAAEALYCRDVTNFMAIWRLLQRDLLTLSTRSEQHIVVSAGHCNLVTDPEFANQVCEKVVEFVRRTRQPAVMET